MTEQLTGQRARTGETTADLSKSQLAYQWIKERITVQDFTPGYRLVLGTIARELAMSQVPVREAVRQLEAEGLVTFERNVGARVSTVDAAQYRFTLQAIGIVESAATALAAPLMTADDLHRARALNAALAGRSPDMDRRSLSALNHQFHQLLYSRCPNPRLVEMVDAEWARLGHLRDSTTAFASGRAKDSIREHEEILTLIESGAPAEDIELAVRRHRTVTIAEHLITERLPPGMAGAAGC